MASSLDLIRDALLEIQAIAVGETPTAAEANDGLRVLNRMLDAWQAQRLAIFATARQLLPLTIGQQAYELGIGSSTVGWGIPRPSRIDYFGVLYPSGSYPIELPMIAYTESDWLQIPLKNTASSLPQGVWDDQGFPFRNLNFWPIPNLSGLQVALYNWVALQQFSDLRTQYGWPPAYLRAIVKNLAMDLLTQYPGSPVQLQVLAAQAAAALGLVKSSNVQPVLVNTDPMLQVGRRGVYNFYTDGANNRGGF